MVAKTAKVYGDMQPETPQMVERVGSNIPRMESFLKEGQFSDLLIICREHVFVVHRLMMARKGTCFGDLLDEEPNRTEINLEDEDPAFIARLVYFLYTGTYPATHIAHVKVQSFIKLSDTYVVAGRNDMLHASMYHIGVHFKVPELIETASLAFRSLDHIKFCQNPDWPALADYIYTSTAPANRSLRNFIIREILYAINQDRASLNMKHLRRAIDLNPELATDLATTTLTKTRYECTECNHDQYLLILPCSHKENHKARDKKCFKMGLEEQECRSCHEYSEFEKW